MSGYFFGKQRVTVTPGNNITDVSIAMCLVLLQTILNQHVDLGRIQWLQS